MEFEFLLLLSFLKFVDDSPNFSFEIIPLSTSNSSTFNNGEFSAKDGY